MSPVQRTLQDFCTDSRPEASVYCACQATRKATAAQRRPRVPQVLLKALCTGPAKRKAGAAQRRVPQVLLQALCIALMSGVRCEVRDKWRKMRGV